MHRAEYINQLQGDVQYNALIPNPLMKLKLMKLCDIWFQRQALD